MRIICVLLLGMVISGCGGDDGPSLYPASGTVTYKGKPISGAVVSFYVEKAPLASGTTDAEGKFVLTTGGRPGVALGKAKVGISKMSEAADVRADMKPEDMAKMGAEMMGKRQRVNAGPKSEIPMKYADPEKSTLTADLLPDGSKNVFMFPLVD